jgi:hypothetical protein
MRRAWPLGAAALAVVVWLGDAAAQTTLDEGTFRLLIAGREVGSETFLIRQTGTGSEAVVIATGRVVLDTTQTRDGIDARLQLAGATLRPAAYDVMVQGGDTIRGRVAGNRFNARILSATGERMREYLVSEGALLADEGVAHHYYFLARQATQPTQRMALLVPREGRQVWATVTVSDPERVVVAGEAVMARRIVVAPVGGVERLVWADESGRVLRVEIPERQYVAERTALPR